MKKQFVFVVFLLVLNSIPKLGYTQLDSLWQIWSNEEVHDTLRMEAMKTICWQGYLFVQPDSAYILAEQLFEFAKAANHQKYQARSFNIRAISLVVRGSSEEAIPLFQKCLNIYKAVAYQKGVASTLNNLAKAFHHIGQYPKALEYYYESLKITEAIQDFNGTALAQSNIGDIHVRMAEYDEALNLYNRSLTYYESTADTSKIALALSGVTNVQKLNKNWEQALPNAEKVVALLEAINEKGLSIGNAYGVLGEVLFRLNRSEQARINFEQALIEYTRAQNKNGINITNRNLGRIYLQQKNWSKAEQYAQKSLEAAQQASDPSLNRNSYLLYANIYEAKKDFENALEMRKRFWAVNDSIYNDRNKSALVEQKIKYEYDTQKAVDELSHQESLRRRNLIVLFLSLSLLCLLGFAYFQYKSRLEKHKIIEALEGKTAALNSANQKILKAQEQLIQQEKLASLGQLTAGIAHEIKNPLNFITNFSEDSKELLEEMDHPIQALNQQVPSDQHTLIQSNFAELKLNISDIIQNSLRVDQVINNMMNHSRKSEVILVETDINQLVNINTDFAYKGFHAVNKSFHTKINKQFAPELPNIKIYPQELGRVILNLVNNACYATYQKQANESDYAPQIEIKTALTDRALTIEVIDNGIGIPKNIITDIFNPFFTTKPTGLANTGLGLSISFDIITNLHKGQLKVESEEGKFSKFFIVLPFD